MPLTEDLANTIAPWFDDPDSIRYLGGRDWLYRELDLIHTAPGSEFRGHHVLARYVWVVHDLDDQPCCLVDIEPYDDGTAGMAIIVAPHRRNQGFGQQVLQALPTLTELRNVHKVVGAVEPENVQARHCFEQAGYTVADLPDEEGMLRIEKSLRVS